MLWGDPSGFKVRPPALTTFGPGEPAAYRAPAEPQTSHQTRDCAGKFPGAASRKSACPEVTIDHSLVLYECIHMAPSRQKAAAAVPPVHGDGSLRVEAAIREQQRMLAAAAAIESSGVEDVHRGRVAARRLRSMLKTFRPLLEPRHARLYRVDLRSFARSLAGVREADVRQQLLAAIAARDATLTPADQERLASLLADARIAAREALHRHRSEPGWAALQGALERHASGPGLIVDHGASLARVLSLVAGSWRRPVRLLENEPESTAELHELRLSLKHCRYALEPVADVAPKATARLMRRLRNAQDCIGEHRDALLAAHWVKSNERLLGRDAAARLVADLERRERQLRHRARKRCQEVLAAWRNWRKATRRIRKAT
jgi:CHAD domain-containing protein